MMSTLLLIIQMFLTIITVISQDKIGFDTYKTLQIPMQPEMTSH